MQRILNPKAGSRARVFLNGEDVSKNCLQALVPEHAGVEAPGQVWLYKTMPDGKFRTVPETMLSDNGPTATHEVLEGLVRWERVETHDEWLARQRPVKDEGFLHQIMS